MNSLSSASRHLTTTRNMLRIKSRRVPCPLHQRTKTAQQFQSTRSQFTDSSAPSVPSDIPEPISASPLLENHVAASSQGSSSSSVPDTTGPSDSSVSVEKEIRVHPETDSEGKTQNGSADILESINNQTGDVMDPRLRWLVNLVGGRTDIGGTNNHTGLEATSLSSPSTSSSESDLTSEGENFLTYEDWKLIWSRQKGVVIRGQVPPIIKVLSKKERKDKLVELSWTKYKLKTRQPTTKEELFELGKYLAAGTVVVLPKLVRQEKESSGTSTQRTRGRSSPAAIWKSMQGERQQLEDLEGDPAQAGNTISSSAAGLNVQPSSIWRKGEQTPSPFSIMKGFQSLVQDFEQAQTPSTSEDVKKNHRKQAKCSTPWLTYQSSVASKNSTKRCEGILEPDKMGDVLEEIEPPAEQEPVAQLCHNLQRVLFNPGIHWLQDPRSRVYNYDPYLQNIPDVGDFAFSRLKPFTPASRDPDIAALSVKHGKLFSGSTSSLTGILCHIYFLISGEKLVNTMMLSKAFEHEPRTFTPALRMPYTASFNRIAPLDGVEGNRKWMRLEDEEGLEEDEPRYFVDSAGSGDTDKNILTWMGHLLEKFLTTPQEEFSGYLKSRPDAPVPKLSEKRDAFRFSKSNNFILRAQLDCYDPRLPGSGVFDIKTRACVPIRLDLFNFEENSGYLIRTGQGKFESFEKEYYDLARSAFLKYQFQVRIGGMDGVIVAYHNTKQLFGFQYIPLEELDECLFGPGLNDSTVTGDRVFKGCLGMLEVICKEVIEAFPNESVKATFETLENTGTMNIWVEPVEWVEESLGPRPIKQIEVRAWSYADATHAKDLIQPYEVFRDIENNWAIRWTIGTLNRNIEDVRKAYEEVKARQSKGWTIPSGVNPAELKDWYDNLNFGGVERPTEPVSTFSRVKFSNRPRGGIQLMRRLAREGRRDTERLREEEAGKPPIVLGQGELFSGIQVR